MNGIRTISILILVTAWAAAKIGGISLHEMARQSDLIIIAKVTKVTPRIPVRYAEATVSKVLKGPGNTQKVLFRASPSWTCDTSHADFGEEALLFLDQGEGNIYTIAHAGRGRMPLRTVRGHIYADVWVDDVWVEQRIPTIAGPDPRYDFIRSVRLDALCQLVKP